MTPSRVVIIGAGVAGTTAAFELRKQGFEGKVCLIGAEDHWPYNRTELSKNTGTPPNLLYSEEAFAEAEIEFRHGAMVRKIDRANKFVQLQTEDTIQYDRLLLATGARAAVPGVFRNLAVLRTRDDIDACFADLKSQDRLVIIGGGLIGTEIAATMVQRGFPVAIVEQQPRLLTRALPEEIAGRLQANLAEHGVDLHLGAKIASVDAQKVVIETGAEIQADRIILAIGARPDIDLAAGSGLSVDDGILVNDGLQTSDSAIYAAGDCCRFPAANGTMRLEAWQPAIDMGQLAARAMLGKTGSRRLLPSFWTDQLDLHVQSVGYADQDGKWLKRAGKSGSLIMFQLDGASRLQAAVGVGPGMSIGKDMRIAHHMITSEAVIDAADLESSKTSLKTLLKEASLCSTERH
ncbi:FAD-dependent oxidoreductase [Roseibium sp. HPY-6]|uniref:NAD(P)/FAD-dependent oxidoreductase n=1 Tax=Roseibium sp. HPY-6 TaxID=3229852 RepID=UPI00338EE357